MTRNKGAIKYTFSHHHFAIDKTFYARLVFTYLKILKIGMHVNKNI